MPHFISMSEPTSPSALRLREIGDAEDDDLLVLVAGGLELALDLLEVALAVEHLHAGLVGEREPEKTPTPVRHISLSEPATATM